MIAKYILSSVVTFAAIAALIAVSEQAASAAPVFTVVAIPDTQRETRDYPEALQSKVNWILDNQASQNIAFVAQQGDLVETTSTPGSNSEWINASEILFQLNGADGLPWGTCAGNHDTASSSNEAAYDYYFGPSNFAGRSWYGGSTFSHSSYQTFQTGGRDYLVLDIESPGPNPEELHMSQPLIDWAQSVIDANPGVPTIVNAHAYLDTRVYYGATPPYVTGVGWDLWDGLVRSNSQIFMVMSAHLPVDSMQRIATNDAGQPVIEVHSDERFGTDGIFGTPDGRLRLYEFDEDNSMIHVKSYSPYNTAVPYLTDNANQFDIPLDFDQRLGVVVPGPPSVVRSTVVLSEDFEGAAPGTTVDGYNGWVSTGSSAMVISGNTIDQGQSAERGEADDHVNKAFHYVPAAGEWYEMTATLNAGADTYIEIDLSSGGDWRPAYRVDYGFNELFFGRTMSNGEWVWVSALGNPYPEQAIDVKMVVKPTGDEGYYRLNGDTAWIPISAPVIGSMTFAQDISENAFVSIRSQGGTSGVDSIQFIACVAVQLTPGDANGDGKIDDADAAILASNWQKASGAVWAEGDFNLDGIINDIDATLLAANWQSGVGQTTAGVPEPSLLTLLCGAMGILWFRRR